MDIANITAVLGLATSAVGLTGKAATTADTIKKLFASDKDPDKSETAQLLNNLAGELTAANMMNVQLSDSLRTLSQELQKQDEFEKEKARYELFQTGENDVVFRLKQDAANGQPSHFICPVCLNRDRLISFITGQGSHKFCQTNKDHTFRFSRSSTPAVVQTRRSIR